MLEHLDNGEVRGVERRIPTGWSNTYVGGGTISLSAAPAKIKLTLSEAFVLRDAAMQNEKLADIVRRFSPYFEIEFDCP